MLAPLIGLVITILHLFAPLLMLLALPFIKWDKAPSTDRRGDVAIRGDLPGWLSWLSTPDERLPGGLYEPEHKKLLNKYGKWFASWYWLGVRNALFGLAMAFRIPADSHIPDVRGWYRSGKVWQYSAQLGPIRFVMGYKVYRILDGSLWAAPCFTAMHRPMKPTI